MIYMMVGQINNILDLYVGTKCRPAIDIIIITGY